MEYTEQELAHRDYPYGSRAIIGSRDRTLYEQKKESFINGLRCDKFGKEFK